MGKVYLVIGTEEYEGSSVVAAFPTENDANAFMAACVEATNSTPQCPAIEDPQEGWDAWDAAHKQWHDAHPAGEHRSYRSWHVEAHELHEPPQERGR